MSKGSGAGAEGGQHASEPDEVHGTRGTYGVKRTGSASEDSDIDHHFEHHTWWVCFFGKTSHFDPRKNAHGPRAGANISRSLLTRQKPTAGDRRRPIRTVTITVGATVGLLGIAICPSLSIPKIDLACAI